jgi:eukaryotic-like serine/threonine-protein kinase
VDADDDLESRRMNVTGELILRSDVILVPVAELDESVRAKFDSEEGDYTISRTKGRMSTQVIDGETAALLQLFREPRTIVDAVIQNSLALKKDPEAWLDELLPHFGVFLRNKVLVPADEPDENEIRQLVDNGAKVGEWDVIRCVSLIEDSEIYRVRRGDEHGALKIARTKSGAGSWVANEERILRHLDGRIGPRLLSTGRHEERPYLVLEWIDGVEAGVAGAMRRHDRVGQLELALSIATAYADLHETGVIHADVHPRNVLVDAAGVAHIIDFGWSRIDDGNVQYGPRAGMFFFFEPEYLASVREHRSLASTRAGEQYAIAALLYFMVSGKHYLDFPLGREEMSRAIEHDPPLPFEARGIARWPELETILTRALAKDPALRFASVREMADALRAAHAEAVRQSLAAPIEPHARELLAAEVALLSRGGELFANEYPAPKSSVNFGAAGAAFGLLRIAQVRSDPKLLALAEVWGTRAMSHLDEPEGWYDQGLTPESIGQVTPYHTRPGLFAVRAFLCRARGEHQGERQWMHAFVNASLAPCREVDLTLGRCGTLLFAALLLDGSRDADVNARLVDLGNSTMAAVWEELDTRPPILERNDRYLGMAHGWVGFLYATLRWVQATGAPLPVQFHPRMADLASLRIPKGRGAQWPRVSASQPWDRLAGWCHGTAGYVFLWLLAHDVLGGDEWFRLAEDAAWNTWEEPLNMADLCCGTAGRAYALLNVYRHTGEREWLSRAKTLANHAASAVDKSLRRHALWKGDFGAAVLIADLESPETARMPLFE